MKNYLLLFVALFLFNSCENDKGSVMPPDGIVPLEDWTYFLAYFDSNTNQITEKYIKMDCNCDLVFFGDEDPRIKNTLN